MAPFGMRKELSVAEAEPTHEQIAALAYELWQTRGCPMGSPDEDWYRAERKLTTSGQANSEDDQELFAESFGLGDQGQSGG